jgi:hypothetical protein
VPVLVSSFRTHYDASRDGSRFLVNPQPENGSHHDCFEQDCCIEEISRRNKVMLDRIIRGQPQKHKEKATNNRPLIAAFLCVFVVDDEVRS